MNKNLPILALETSGDLCSVALIIDEKSFVELNYFQKHIHSKKIIGIIDSVLSNANLKPNEVGSIALSSGPGSFTGLRIGFSAAKAIAFGSNIGIIHVPTFHAFAYQIAKNLPADTEFVIANKASMEEFYTGKYISKSVGFEIIEELKIINKDNIQDYINGVQFYFGNILGRNDLLNASSVGQWAYLFGKDLLTFDYDYIEPEYFGNPFFNRKNKQ